MFLQSIDLSTALRPSLLPGEVLLFVQDAVGLYKGCVAFPASQSSRAISLLFRNRAELLTLFLSCAQEIQDPELPKWPGLPYFT